MTKKTKPSVFDYLDVVHFLQSYFDWRKELNNHFSLSEWSKEMGFGSSVTLRFILKKMRRISGRSVQIFKNHLFEKSEEAKCFETLVNYSQAKNTEERKAFGLALLNLHKQQMSYKTVDASVASRNVFGPLVLTLMTFKDIKKNAKILSSLLRTEEEQIETILKEFESENVITKNSEGHYDFTADLLRIPDHPNLKKFYEYWIEQSKQALKLPVETRKFRSLNFALTPEEYSRVLEKLDEYAAGLLSQFNSSNLTNRTVYMFESSLFPVTKHFSEADLI